MSYLGKVEFGFSKRNDFGARAVPGVELSKYGLVIRVILPPWIPQLIVLVQNKSMFRFKIDRPLKKIDRHSTDATALKLRLIFRLRMGVDPVASNDNKDPGAQKR